MIWSFQSHEALSITCTIYSNIYALQNILYTSPMNIDGVFMYGRGSIDCEAWKNEIDQYKANPQPTKLQNQETKS